MRTIPLLLIPALAVAVSGCTPQPSPDVTRPVRTTPTTAVEALTIPKRLPSEISRTVLMGTSNDGIIGEVPKGTKALYVHLAPRGGPAP